MIDQETSTEMRDFARVMKAALGVLLKYWEYPPQHPYRQAATMVLRYIEGKYRI